jgi:hypothetical protein
MNRATWLLLLVPLACDQGSGGGASSAAPTASATTAATASPSGSTQAATGAGDLDKEDIPVSADFDDEAEKAITDDNLDEEVDKLDKEIVEEK